MVGLQKKQGEGRVDLDLVGVGGYILDRMVRQDLSEKAMFSQTINMNKPASR